MESTQQPDFAEFERQALKEGFDEVAVRKWTPGQVVGTHTHPFSVKALVVQGEMTLTDDREGGVEGADAASRSRVLRAGDWFELDRGAPHAERYGPEGAIYWAARKHAAG